MLPKPYTPLPDTLCTIGLLALLAALVFGLSAILPAAIDWHETFRPAAREVLAGRSPYNIVGYMYPPWAILFILPMALLPEKVGQSLFLITNMLVLAYTAYRLKASPATMAIFLISPPVVHGLLNANIDWLTVLGFVLPPQIGIFFIIIKPQVGAAVAVFWLIEAWRKNGWREAVRIFWPVTLALLLSFLIFGLWPVRHINTLSFWWNASLWPVSIPVGLALLIAAIRKRQKAYAMAASPCLSPYVLFHSWVGALLAIVTSLPETIAAVAGLWILVAIRAFQL